MNIYQENGYDSRNHYLRCLAEDAGISFQEVQELAYILGDVEDFDGLLTTLESKGIW